MVGGDTLGRRTLNIYLPLAFFLIFLLFPFYWMSIVSLKPTNDLFDLKFNPFWIQHFTLENYLYLFQNTEFPEWVKNTIIVSVVSTALSLTCSVFIGYALARLRFPGSNFLGVGIFLAYLVPPTLLFLPLAQVIAGLGLYNTYWALILTYPTQLIPFASWLLMGYFRTIPKEIEESAMLKAYEVLEKNDKNNQNFIIIGPWNHGGWDSGSGESLGRINFGTPTGETFRKELQAPFFAYYLKGKGSDQFHEAVTFQTGSNI